MAGSSHKAAVAMIGKRRTKLELSCDALERMDKEIGQDLKIMRDLLVRHGDGSFLRGWRRELDPDGLLKVGFQAFLQGCVRMNFYGDTLGLFQLDSDPSNFHLSAVGPRESRNIDTFRVWLKESFGSLAEFFKVAFPDMGTLTREEFLNLVVSRGGEFSLQDLNEIFDFCDVSNDDTVYSEEVLFLETNEEVREAHYYKVRLGKMMQWRKETALEYCHLVDSREKAKKERAASPANRRAPRPWQDRFFDEMPTVKSHQKVLRLQQSKLRSVVASLHFREHVRKTFGNEIRAWRRCLAPRGHEITPTALRQYCGLHGLKIRVKDLWYGLDTDRDGSVRLEEINIKWATALAQFRHWARGQFECTEKLWDQPEVASTARRMAGTWFADKGMKSNIFKVVLKQLGWPGCKDKETFRFVLNGLDKQGFGYVERSDLVWLDNWHPSEWVCSEPSEHDWRRLEALLVQNCGHLLRAWRILLDKDDSNSVSWKEFSDACRKLKFDGDIGGAWKYLDQPPTGVITMKDYDLDSFTILCSFKEWVDVNFGGVQACFSELDEDRSGAVTFKEMRHACRKLYFQGDVKLLFDCIFASHYRQAARDTPNSAEAGSRCFNLNDLSFLDSWEVEPSEEDVAQAVAAESSRWRNPNDQKKSTTKYIECLNQRLTSPLDIIKLGYSTWSDALGADLSLANPYSLSNFASTVKVSKLSGLSPYAISQVPRKFRKEKSQRCAPLPDVVKTEPIEHQDAGTLLSPQARSGSEFEDIAVDMTDDEVGNEAQQVHIMAGRVDLRPQRTTEPFVPKFLNAKLPPMRRLRRTNSCPV